MPFLTESCQCYKSMAIHLSPKLPTRSTFHVKMPSLLRRRPCRKISEKVVSYLSLYDLEKAYTPPVIVPCWHYNGKAWRLIKACYSNQTAVVKSGSSLSNPFPITRGVQQGLVLSPTFFLIVMDKLLP